MHESKEGFAEVMVSSETTSKQKEYQMIKIYIGYYIIGNSILQKKSKNSQKVNICVHKKYYELICSIPIKINKSYILPIESDRNTD